MHNVHLRNKKDIDSQSLQTSGHTAQLLRRTVFADFWPHGAAAKAYGVFNEERGCATRGTFVIDKEGILRWQVVNGLGDARNVADYKGAIASL